MPGRKNDTERTHDKLLDSMQVDPISEEEADELRDEGTGFERKGRDTGDEVERLAQGQTPSDDPRSYRTPAQPGRTQSASAADEDAPGRRGGREGYTESEATQLEEDFGERGLRMKGGKHDAEHKPSILEPEPE